MKEDSTKDTRQDAVQHRSAAGESGGRSIAMPSVPLLQYAIQHDAPALLSQSNVAQLKRDRKDEEEPAQMMSADHPVQLAVKPGIPNGTRIVIDNLGASDFGDIGTIIRNSGTKPNCKVVEFDNEPGQHYRVYLHEMSPLLPDDKAAYGTPSSTIKQLGQAVRIEVDIDLSTDESQSADFMAFNGEHQIGELKLKKAGDTGFIISHVYTNMSPEHSIQGLGALFLNISARMAKKLGSATMLLAAHRQSMAEKHPAPFYAKFDFVTDNNNEEMRTAEAIGMTFDEYIERTTLEMRGNTDAVAGKTSVYLADKGW